MAISFQPSFGKLNALLVSLGGTIAVAPDCEDPMVDDLLSRGFAQNGLVSLRKMIFENCSTNVAALWLEDPKSVIAIGIGYALTADGLWRPHSWGISADGILETTGIRDKYFGLLLTGIEADYFAERLAPAVKRQHRRKCFGRTS